MEMINEQTLEKMRAMRMNHLARILQDMEESHAVAELTFEERVGLLIDTEWEYRQNNKTRRLVDRAGFIDANASIEGIDYRPDRNIDRPLIFKLSTCDYIKARQDVLILGKAGVGKSYLAQALGHSACRNRIATRYIALDDLLDELAVAEATSQQGKAFDSFVKPSLLILDDFFLTKPSVAQAERILRLIEKRMHVGSTIYCSQLRPDEWHERIDEKIIADAIVDRVIYRSHVILLDGDSMRKTLKP